MNKRERVHAYAGEGTPASPGASSDFSDEQLVDVASVLESYRDSGLDLASAVGEVIDNAIQAGANIINIDVIRQEKGIAELAFIDNGVGIPNDVLSNVLKLGFSTRYNDRQGLGRFGVGLKIAGISFGRRIDVYTWTDLKFGVDHTFLDLDLVDRGDQRRFSISHLDDLPKKYQKMAQNLAQIESRSKRYSGTLIVWSKLDRLRDGRAYGTSSKEEIDETRQFIARAYRKLIDDDVQIFLDGKLILLHDPLFCLPNPRIIEKFGEDAVGTIVHAFDIDVPLDGGATGKVRGIVTLAPEIFRLRRGKGGKTEESIHRISADTQGCISLVRNGREIYYDLIPRMYPTKVEDVDRFIGIEISFDASLDALFQVRNIKRGAEPVPSLKRQIKLELTKPLRDARKEIALVFDRTRAEETSKIQRHQQMQSAVNRRHKTLRPTSAASDMSIEQVHEVLREVLSRENGDTPTEEQIATLKSQLESEAIQYRDGSWPGKLIFETRHLNGRFVITLNNRHPLIKGVYNPIAAIVNLSAEEKAMRPSADLLRKAIAGFDSLFIAYARAESMSHDPENEFDELREDWGRYTAAFLEEATTD